MQIVCKVVARRQEPGIFGQRTVHTVVFQQVFKHPTRSALVYPLPLNDRGYLELL